jgi:hypothetical protein
MDVRLPDGTVIQNVPDGMSKADLTTKLSSNGYDISKLQSASSPTQSYNNTLNVAGMDTHIPISQNTQNFLAGAGKAFSDLGTGIGQVTGLGSSTNQDVSNTRQLDAPLMNTKAGMGGNLTGNIAATLPAMTVPGVNTYTGAAALGATLGAIQPTVNGSERLRNTLLGGGAGVVGQGIGNTLGKIVRPFKSNLSPEESRLAQVATDSGIPLNAAEQIGSKPLKIVNSVLENLPLTSGSEIAQRNAQQSAFNSAVLNKAGITADVATPDVLAAGKQTVGSQLGDIAKSNVLDFNQGLIDKLASIVDNASQHLPPAKAGQIADQVDQILSQVGKDGNMSGSNYQGWRQPLNILAKKGDEFSSYYGQIKSSLDSAFRDQLPGDTGQQFRDLSGQYANLKTVIGSMGGNSPSTLAGNISPAQLGMALSQNIGREGKALGKGSLNDLVRAGNLFVRPQIQDSGTAQRLMIQSLLTGGGSGVGALAAGLTGHDPMEGALYGAATTGAGLALPKLIQTLVNNKPIQNYLVNQASSPNAALIAKLLQNTGRTLGAGTAGLISQ